MGINLGGLLAPLICGTLVNSMVGTGDSPRPAPGWQSGSSIYCSFFRLLPREPDRALLAAEAKADHAPVIRKHVAILLLMIAMVVLFRVGYEQSGNVIALWVRDFTDRSVGGLADHSRDLVPVDQPAAHHSWNAAAHSRMEAGKAQGNDGAFAPADGHRLSHCQHGNGGHGVSRSRERPRRSPSKLVVGARLFRAADARRAVRHPGRSHLGRVPLAPVRFASMAMGGWYIAKFLGSLLAGFMGVYWQVIPPWAFFGVGLGSTMLAALCLFWMAKATRNVPMDRAEAVRTSVTQAARNAAGSLGPYLPFLSDIQERAHARRLSGPAIGRGIAASASLRWRRAASPPGFGAESPTTLMRRALGRC